ncbi:MAG: hypothetical protein OEV46_05745, partial [Betaproteobacteria bacterium]|nr:hypothetical protein [Betaproteobacteria bacterium]
MPRTTLKLTKPVDREKPAKPPTSRAWRVHGKALARAATAAPSAPAPAEASRAAPAAGKSRRGKPPPAKRALDGKAAPAKGERRSS